jgi:hypothetical protein
MDPFLFQSQGERARQIAAYTEYLHQRDGQPNRTSRTLPKRAAFFDELARQPVRWQGPLDRATFHENLGRRTESGLDPRLLWLLGAAKANRGEKFGVELALARSVNAGSEDDPHCFVQLEEIVHTRLLLEACRLFDLEVEIAPPALTSRLLIHAMTLLPGQLSAPLVLCGEVAGCVMFQLLWEQAELFGEQPEVAERLRLIVREILIDELGHVAFARALLGAAALGIARRILPSVARALVHDMPEFAWLAGSQEQFVDRVLRFDLGAPAGARDIGALLPILCPTI